MTLAQNLECARIGADRELKNALQACFKGDTTHDFPAPEFTRDQPLSLSWEQLLDDVQEVRALGHQVQPVIIGPLTYLWLGKAKDNSFDKLELLDRLLPIYGELLGSLAGQGVEWVQIEEPILSLDLPQDWKNAFERAYHSLQYSPLKKLVATCSGGLGANLGLAVSLPVQGLHVDLLRAPEQAPTLLDRLPTYKVLSLEGVNDRNIESSDQETANELLREAQLRFGDNLWVAGSGSLLHSPVSLSAA